MGRAHDDGSVHIINVSIFTLARYAVCAALYSVTKQHCAIALNNGDFNGRMQHFNNDFCFLMSVRLADVC
jgi:hypothetical protein